MSLLWGPARDQPAYINIQVMDESYRRYKGKVNFLWVYSSEAHPEERPFAKGYETRDLGWQHPYTFTSNMKERAERAKWMKTDPDPDLEIPMLIDFINSSPRRDNEIRQFYMGAGFYSGYVIDCDGTILQRRPWAWYGEGGEWWDLPLTPVEELHSFLDGYLANPPVCYRRQDRGNRER